MPPNPREPVVLIRNNPIERVDPDVGQRVKERLKRIRTDTHSAAPSRDAPPSDPDLTEPPPNPPEDFDGRPSADRFL